MNLKFPNHVQDMISYRNIDVEHIKLALREPDFTESTFEGRMLARKKVGEDKVIEVIYYKDGFRDKKNDYIVITAYYLTN